MKSSNKESTFPCIIPTIPTDYARMHLYYKYLFRYLPIDQILFIGPDKLESEINIDLKEGIFDSEKISFIDENSLIPLSELKPVFNSLITEENNLKPTAVNWYYQQFLKLAFSLKCESDYYLCWDSDTIPLKKIDMFSPDDKPYLDIKSEYNAAYFLTIERLFGFSKIIEKSFISEHMLFNTDFIREMIGEINKTHYDGKNFYEKILYAVGSDNLNQGFSEFETYGTWIGVRHSSAYKLREWKSFRNTNFFSDITNITQNDLDWLSIDYDAATFEKYQETNEVLSTLFKDPRYREKLSPKQFYQTILESGILGEYTNNAISSNDFSAPT